MYYRTCQRCGAHLDPGERCEDCENAYAEIEAACLGLTEERQRQVVDVMRAILAERKSPSDAATPKGAGNLIHQNYTTKNHGGKENVTHRP